MSKTPREMIEDLKELDPDYVVDVLDISSEELVEAFPYKLIAFLKSELGEDYDDESLDELDPE